MSGWQRLLDSLTPVRLKIARAEAAAEAAYTAMYDAQPYNVKDCYEDAMSYLNEAIALAQKAHLRDEATRLKARATHIRDVYDHQFRYIGR